MSLKIIFREFNEDEEGLRFYVSDSPLDAESLPEPIETGPSNTLTDESEEYGDHAVSHTVSWDIKERAYVKAVAHRGGDEVASQQWEYEPPEEEHPMSGVSVGDYVGGGVYAGINEESDGNHYFIIFATQDGELAPGEGVDTRWKVERTETPGTKSETDGWENTLAMEDAGLADHPAAAYCREYRGGGYGDWYLPSTGELSLEENLRDHEELSESTFTGRWSSTENFPASAFDVSFSDGWASNSFKDSGLSRVRPVRRMEVPESLMPEPGPFEGTEVGDYAGGGVYAGVQTIGGVDYHIIVGTAESEVAGVMLKTSRTGTQGTSDAWDGLANTLAMKDAGLEDHPAADYCINYNGGGYDDWHIPADRQLRDIASKLKDHPEFSGNVAAGKDTWSSTEDGDASGFAKTYRISSGIGTMGKNSTNGLLRPIRRVPVS